MVSIINNKLGIDKREKISAGTVVKAIIINGLGFVSRPLYLFSQFFSDKGVEILLGEGVKKDDLNDDKIGRVLVYNLGQRELINCLKRVKTGVKNQVGKLTNSPTLRWIFQCFQGIHVVTLKGVKQIINLTDERRNILSFLPYSCPKYYLLSGSVNNLRKIYANY